MNFKDKVIAKYEIAGLFGFGSKTLLIMADHNDMQAFYNILRKYYPPIETKTTEQIIKESGAVKAFISKLKTMDKKIKTMKFDDDTKKKLMPIILEEFPITLVAKGNKYIFVAKDMAKEVSKIAAKRRSEALEQEKQKSKEHFGLA